MLQEFAVKIQYKISLFVFIIGIISITTLSFVYNIHSHRIILEEKQKDLSNLSEEVSLHLNSHITEKISIGKTFTTNPFMIKALHESNSIFSKLTEIERANRIDKLNKKWMDTKNINDPFIQNHLTNTVAQYLKKQQEVLPGEYGEIFLTNRYGVMISSTGKLTTLAHAHKYWWKESFNNGKGKIFLDDRGFDASVEGYVLGVVIPIIENGEFLGILKCNVNVMGQLTDIVHNFIQRFDGFIKIARTGGLIVSEKDASPLSSRVNAELEDLLKKYIKGTALISDKKNSFIVAYTPIPITLSSDDISFGGKSISIDHSEGNQNEAWHVIIKYSEDKLNEIVHRSTKQVLLIGLALTFFISLSAMFAGRYIAAPILPLINTARKIGEGDFNARAEIHSDDEIGTLAKSVNHMANELKNTMTKLKESNKDLQDAFINIDALNNLLPICSYCRKIRDDEGYWNLVEDYVAKHTKTRFSHGICPDCAKDEFPDFNQKD